MMDFSLWQIAALCISGLVAGAINTVAGGGSNLTLPVLMMLGLPADVANGTNRVAITLQCIVGISGYDKHNTLDRPAIVPILIPTLMGGVIGAVAAALIDPRYLKPILLGSILLMSAVILVKPATIAPPEGTVPFSPKQSRAGWWGLLAAGIYGGFVQAGVGFMLIAALAGGLRYSLVQANALKMVCTLAFTLVALAVFVYFDQVWWVPGLILAIGMMIGAHFAVKVAVKASQNSIKWFLFAMTLFACAGGYFL